MDMHPAARSRIATRLVRTAVDRAALEFIVALLPAFGVGRDVELRALARAERRVEPVLTLHAEDGVAKAQIVGIRALGRVDTGAASQERDSKKENARFHTRRTAGQPAYSGETMAEWRSWSRCP